MITLEQLQKFCAKIDPLGRETRHLVPFRRHGYVYATDSRICIRIKDDGALQVASNEDSHRNYYAEVFECVENCDLPLPALPEFIPCKHCKGTGLSHDCPVCDGAGCAECSKGKLAHPIDTEPCWWCNGRGEQEDNPIAVGNVHFNRIYLALAAEMPGARFVSVNGYAVALIKFDGGEIAIMPTRT